MISFDHIVRLPAGVVRTLYVQGASAEALDALDALGYDVVDLMTMPRGDPPSEEAYLKAKCQAMEEGTIDARPEDRHRLELAMKAHGLLQHDRKNVNLNVNLDGKTLDDILNWGADRHVLANNSTVQSAAPGVIQKLVEGTILKGND